MSILALQKRLKAIGKDPGPLDGVMGPSTLRAINEVIDEVSPVLTPPPPPVETLVPTLWMPWAKMDRVIVHWTAGTYKANATDRKPYHILIEGDGALVRGDYPISANAAPAQSPRANHTLNCNTGSIGVSLCCMAGEAGAVGSARSGRGRPGPALHDPGS
jgi:peptidoglycan hydrolase-like protein with peptidoglycan-binding domain